MVDTVTTKGIAVSATTVARQGYWRGVFRRLLRDPGGVFVGAIILVLLTLALFGPGLSSKTRTKRRCFTPQADRYRRLPAELR